MSDSAELRERVARALFADFTLGIPSAIRTEHFDHEADVVLAALGLDNMEAAVDRIAVALVEAWEQAGKDWLANRALCAPFDPNRIGVPERWMAGKALAALTPPEAKT